MENTAGFQRRLRVARRCGAQYDSAMLEARKPFSFDELYKQLCALPENVTGEIIDGQLYAMTRPFSPHTMATGAIYAQLWNHLGRRPPDGNGWIFQMEPELHLTTPDGNSHVVVPDLAAWRQNRLPGLPRTGYITVAPDWVCEVLSESTARKDKGPKRRIYHRAGVPYLWFVDPLVRNLEAYRREGEFWVLLDTQEDTADVRIEPFEDVAFALEPLWEWVEKEG